jgi:hypothetical protein
VVIIEGDKASLLSFARISAVVGIQVSDSETQTGLTRFLEEGGTLEAAQNIADHADSRTTKLYDRRQQVVLLEDVERIRYWLLLLRRLGTASCAKVCSCVDP